MGTMAERNPKTIFLFDVDGTLVECGQKIEAPASSLLKQVQTKASVGLVSGAALYQLEEQLGVAIWDLDFLFTENGIVSYRGKELLSRKSIQEHLGEERVQQLIDFCLNYISKLRLPFKRGHFVDFRTGIINVSPVGRACSLDERRIFIEYDLKHNIRQSFVEALSEAFGSWKLHFAIGGLIGIDIYPQGWDKTLCLQYLKAFEKIHFFGDRTLPGENDYELFQDSRTTGHSVTGPQHTVQLVTALLQKM